MKIMHVVALVAIAGSPLAPGHTFPAGQSTSVQVTAPPQKSAPAIQPTRVDEGREKALIRGVLERQVEAWNEGDVEQYMQGYWHSDKLVFASSAGFSRGWEKLLERYRYNYPDRKAMGRLEFSELEITLLGDGAALILGEWQVDRELDGRSERLGGVFTLVARKFPYGWRIISDHTSSVKQ